MVTVDSSPRVLLFALTRISDSPSNRNSSTGSAFWNVRSITLRG